MENYIFNTTDELVEVEDVDKVIKFACSKLNVVNPLLNIVIVDNKKIQEINKIYRDKDAVTDVISFAFEESDNLKYDNMRFLGEIYISYDKCVEQAKEYGHSIKREFCYLAVHGLLHLLGYDHIKEEDKKVMRALEEEILDEYDIKR
jgi:probable rRNA maturation factor